MCFLGFSRNVKNLLLQCQCVQNSIWLSIVWNAHQWHKYTGIETAYIHKVFVLSSGKEDILCHQGTLYFLQINWRWTFKFVPRSQTNKDVLLWYVMQKLRMNHFSFTIGNLYQRRVYFGELIWPKPSPYLQKCDSFKE